MLILNRKAGETITIDNIKITIVKITGSSVRIGIEAPPELVIIRGELERDDNDRHRR